MNRQCQGDYFVSEGLYRCLYDGTFVDMPQLASVCPQCQRTISAHKHRKASFKVELVTSIRIPSLNTWVEITRKPAEHKMDEVGGTLGYD